MPKRSDRVVFQSAFNGNPFYGLSPQEVYKIIQWGNNPNKVISIDAPEPISALGTLAKLVFSGGNASSFKKGSFYLALGVDSNRLYIFPKHTRYIPDMDDDNWFVQPMKVRQTDYHSNKGGEACYYYHKHERPYPSLITNGSVHAIIPDKFNNQRSYAVIKEGIVG